MSQITIYVAACIVKCRLWTVVGGGDGKEEGSDGRASEPIITGAGCAPGKKAQMLV